MRLAPPTALTAITASLRGMYESILGRLPHVAVALVVFALSLALAQVARWGIVRATQRGDRANLGLVLGRLGYFMLVVVGALVGITIVAPSMTPGRLVSVLGLGGVAAGLAFKDIFQNLFAGILLLWRQPFRVGDEISAVGFTGIVEAIETRATLIKTYDGQRIIVPNNRIYTEPVAVITAYDMLRTEYDIGIGYGDDIERARAIVKEILDGTEGVLRAPAPDVLVWALAESTVDLRVRFWSRPERGTVLALRSIVLRQIRERFARASIDLPYPTRVLLLHDQTEDADGDRARQREGWPEDEHPRQRDGHPVHSGRARHDRGATVR